MWWRSHHLICRGQSCKRIRCSITFDLGVRWDPSKAHLGSFHHLYAPELFEDTFGHALTTLAQVRVKVEIECELAKRFKLPIDDLLAH